MKTAYDGSLDKFGLEQSRRESFCFIISILICVVITSLFIVPYLAEPSFEHNKIVLANKINPNNASASSLLRLSGVGMVRARAIVAYRQDFNKRDTKKPAFENCDDLQKVKGIGPKTIQNISEWLKFE